MINLKHNEEHTRLGVSCHDCQRLHDLDEKEGCKAREQILDPTTEWCNFAAYGCSRYLGDMPKQKPRRGGFKDHFTHRDINKKIREHLLSGAVFKLSMCEDWGIQKNRLHNNIVVLEKAGHNVEKSKVENDRHYKIKFK
jgi:hypothetical protein